MGAPPGPPRSMDATTADTAGTSASSAGSVSASLGTSPSGRCGEGEIEIMGQCINIEQLLGRLGENKQNLKELVKEEIRQLIISKNLDLKGNK